MHFTAQYNETMIINNLHPVQFSTVEGYYVNLSRKNKMSYIQDVSFKIMCAAMQFSVKNNDDCDM